MPPSCRTAIRSVILALIALGSLAPVAMADVQLSVDVGWSGKFRPGRWNPLFITTTSSEPRAVMLEMYAPTDQRYALRIGQQLTAQQVPRITPLYVPLSYSMDQSSVALRDANSGKLLDSFTLDEAAAPIRTRPEPINEGQIFAGVSGNEGTARLLESQMTQSNVTCGFLPLPYMPSVSQGLDAIDLLILNGPNLSKLDADQQSAIVQWVRAGGTLVFWPGNDPLPESGPLLELLPCRFGAARTWEIPAKTLSAMSLPGRFSNLNGRTVTATEEHANKVELFSGSELAAYRGGVGYGQILAVPADLSLLTFNDKAHARTFWKNALAGMVALYGEDEKNPNYYGYGDHDPRQQRATAQALDWIGGVPGAGEFGFSYLAISLLAMMFVVGPVDWFLLKWMGRQPWTWVTTTGWIALITLSAISLGQLVKSGDLHFRSVSLIDEEGGQRAAKMIYTGIYSPRTRQYPVQFSPQSWWRPATEGSYYGGSGLLTEIGCHQDYRGNQPLPMLINVWNLRFLKGEDTTPAQGLIVANLSRHGDAIEGTIENRADFAMTNVTIRTSDGVIRYTGGDDGKLRAVGEIPPHASVSISGTLSKSDQSFTTTKPSPANNWQGPADYAATTQPSVPRSADICIERTDRIEQMLKERKDIACVYANFQAPPDDVKLDEPELHQMHTGMIRAIVQVK